MKKFLIFLNIAFLTFISHSAFAANRNLVFGGYSFGEDTSYGYLGGATALNGDIEKSGTLLRIGSGFGQYNYATTAVGGNNVRGQVSSVDLMVGYQQYFEKGRITLYAGADYNDYSLNKNDVNNRVNGGKSGAKTQIELFLNPTENLIISNISNYTSAYNSYWSQTYVGWNFGKFTFGPEVSFLGNRSFKQHRFGGNFSNIDIGFAKLYLAAGYLKSSGLAGDDGAYTSIGFSKIF